MTPRICNPGRRATNQKHDLDNAKALVSNAGIWHQVFHPVSGKFLHTIVFNRKHRRSGGVAGVLR